MLLKLADLHQLAYPRVCGVGSLVFNVFEVMREPSMQIAYLFPELIVH